MKDNHISEEDLQQIAEGLPIQNEIKTHLNYCASCREKLYQYKQLVHVLKLAPSFKLRPDFLHRIMEKLPEKKLRFSLDYFWIVLSSMVAAGILIYFVGLNPFSNALNVINSYLQQSLPLIYKPLDSFFEQVPIDWHHFLLGGTGLLFVVIIDLLIKQVLPHTMKKG